MNEEVNPADVKRGIVAQREHRSGRVTIRDPKKVKLMTREYEDEEWVVWSKFHTPEDAKKAAKAASKNRLGVSARPVRKWMINGEEFVP